MDLEVVEHTEKRFEVSNSASKVERTRAWLLNKRRHSHDDEVLTASREVMIQTSMIRILLKRLA